jgi:uncharacterized phage protein (TIGR01671 family)
MRELKFRGLNQEGNFIYGDLVQDKENNRCAIIPQKGIEHDYNSFEVDVNSVCEFTGLLDKNDKESFEKDSCKYEYWIQTSQNPDDLGKTYKGLGVIEFINGAFFIVPKNENHIPLFYDELTFEIIGNIYQNPELL